MIIRAFVLMPLILAWSQAFASKDNYPFRVITEDFGNFHRILARNEGPAPIAAVINITLGRNATTDRSWPAVVTVPPGQALVVGRVFHTANNGQRYPFQTTASFRIGDLNASQAPGTLYRLPFVDGLTFPLTQAFGGPVTTHTTPDSRHAVDITMPEGTLVVAARAGTVVQVDSAFTEGGKFEVLLTKANGVVVAHDDGTVGRYLHFTPRRQLVTPGQRVEVGTPLGYSGSTGYSSGPHLHFAVTRVTVGQDGTLGEESLPITFFAHNPPVTFKPQAGTMVMSDYTNPVSVLQARAPAIPGTQRTGAAPVGQPDPVLDALAGLKTWLDGRIGRTWWLWCLCCLDLLVVGGREKSGYAKSRRPIGRTATLIRRGFGTGSRVIHKFCA